MKRQIIISKEGFNKNVKYNMIPNKFTDEKVIIKENQKNNDSKGFFGKLLNRSKVKVINLTITGNNNTTYFKF